MKDQRVAQLLTTFATLAERLLEDASALRVAYGPTNRTIAVTAALEEDAAVAIEGLRAIVVRHFDRLDELDARVDAAVMGVADVAEVLRRHKGGTT